MGLFDFLKSKPQETKIIQPKMPTKTYKNIEEVLDLNLSELPDNSFDVTEVTDNGYGDTIRNYKNNETKNICNLFDSIEIKKFIGKPNKNFVFTNSSLKNITSLKELTNNLSQIYGDDSQNLGKFSAQDEKDIKEGYWSGRTWLDYDKYRTPAMISFDDESGISLTVFKTK